MFYGADEFIADFHAVLLDCAEFVGMGKGMADPAAFRRAKLSSLRFSGSPVVSADAARELFWRRLGNLLASKRERVFGEGATWRCLANPADRDRRIGEFLAALFTLLKPSEPG